MSPLEPCSGVYVILNKASGNCYVGASTNVQKRVWTHLSGKPGKGSAGVAAAISKYGRDALEGFLLERAPRADLPAREARWIKALAPAYNRSELTSTGGKIISAEHREKLRQANLGKKMLPHLIEKMRERLRGHPVSAETREKIAVKARGRKHGEAAREKLRANWAAGDHTERRAKISAVQVGRKQAATSKAKRSAALIGKPWSAARRAAYLKTKEYRL